MPGFLGDWAYENKKRCDGEEEDISFRAQQGRGQRNGVPGLGRSTRDLAKFQHSFPCCFGGGKHGHGQYPNLKLKCNWGMSLLGYSRKKINHCNLIMRKHQPSPSWGTVYKIPDSLHESLRSWRTRTAWVSQTRGRGHMTTTCNVEKLDQKQDQGTENGC